MARRKFTDVERNLMRDIAYNLKKILKERRMSQKDLADMTGLSTSVISDYINEKTLATPGSVQILSDALDIYKSDIDPTFKGGLTKEASSSYKNGKQLVSKIDLGDELLMDQFKVVVDGRELSEKELKRVLAQIRLDRDLEE